MFDPEAPPELETARWFNAEKPLTLKSLKGKVVVMAAAVGAVSVGAADSPGARSPSGRPPPIFVSDVHQDDEPLAKGALGGTDAGVHLLVRKAQVLLRERLTLADAGLFDLGKEVDIHVSLRSTVDGRRSVDGLRSSVDGRRSVASSYCKTAAVSGASGPVTTL